MTQRRAVSEMPAAEADTGHLRRAELRARVQLELAESIAWAKVTPPTLAGSGNRLLFHLSEAQHRNDVACEESLARRALRAATLIELGTCEAVAERIYVAYSNAPAPPSRTPDSFAMLARGFAKGEREARAAIADEYLDGLKAMRILGEAAARILQEHLRGRDLIEKETNEAMRRISRRAIREAPLFLVVQPAAFFFQCEADARLAVEGSIAVDRATVEEMVMRCVAEAVEAQARGVLTHPDYAFCLQPAWLAVTRDEAAGRSALLADELRIRCREDIAAAFASLTFQQGCWNLVTLERYSRSVFEATALRALLVLGRECLGRQSAENAFLEVLCRGKAIPFAISLQFRRKQVAERLTEMEQAAADRKKLQARGVREDLTSSPCRETDELNVAPLKNPRDRDDAKVREMWKLHFELTRLIDTIHRAVSSTIISSASQDGGRKHALSPSPPAPSTALTSSPAMHVCVAARCRRFDSIRLRQTQNVQSVSFFTSPTKACV
jgi:hypothetical protein